MKKYEIKTFNRIYKVKIQIDRYINGALCVRLTEDTLPFATLSVNLPHSINLPKDVFYSKTWSENEGIIEQLERQGAVKRCTDIKNIQLDYVKAKAYQLNN